MIMNIHQKYWEFPIDATGAAASATKTTQITVSIASMSLNFFFAAIFSTSFMFFTITAAPVFTPRLLLEDCYAKVTTVPVSPARALTALSRDVIMAFLSGFARTNFIAA